MLWDKERFLWVGTGTNYSQIFLKELIQLRDRGKVRKKFAKIGEDNLEEERKREIWLLSGDR